MVDFDEPGKELLVLEVEVSEDLLEAANYNAWNHAVQISANTQLCLIVLTFISA